MTAQDASGQELPEREPSPGAPSSPDHADAIDTATDTATGTGNDVGNDAALEEERLLVERARTDRAAFAELYRRHVQAVYAVAHRRSGSREVAEEATSAAFERALRSIDRFEWRAGGIRPWLFRIVSNEVVEIHRRRSRLGGRRGQLALRGLAADDHVDGWASTAPDGPSAGGTSSDVELPRGIDRAVLHAAIDRLSERHRAVIALRYLAGLSAADAADQLGCTKAALAVTLHRALKALRVELDGLGVGGLGGAS